MIRTYYTFCSGILEILWVRVVLKSTWDWNVNICSKIWLNMLECSHERRWFFILLSPWLLLENIAPTAYFLLIWLFFQFLNCLGFVFCRFKNIKLKNLLLFRIVYTPSRSRILNTMFFTLHLWFFCFISIRKWFMLRIWIYLSPKFPHTGFKCFWVVVRKLSMVRFLRFG